MSSQKRRTAVCLFLFFISSCLLPSTFSWADASFLKSLWKKAEEGDFTAAKKLGDHYFKKRAFSQAKAQYERLLNAKELDIELIDSLVLCLFGMNEAKSSLRKYQASKEKGLNLSVLIVQLQIALGAEQRASKALEDLLQFPLSDGLSSFLSTTVPSIMPRPRAKEILLKLVERELAKDCSSFAPFKALAPYLIEDQQEDRLCECILEYLSKQGILEDFSHPKVSEFFDSQLNRILETLPSILEKGSCKPFSKESPDPDFRIKEGIYSHYRGRKAQALAAFDKAREGMESHGPLDHLTLASILEQLSYRKEAIKELRIALDKPLGQREQRRVERPEHFRGLLYGKLSKLCLEQGRDLDAIDGARRSILEDPSQGEALSTLEHYMGSSVFRERVNRALREAAELASSPPLQVLLAESEEEMGNHRAQAEAAKKALKLDPLSDRALKCYVEASLELDKCEEAIKACMKQVKLSQSPKSWKLLTQATISSALIKPIRACLQECLFAVRPVSREGLLCYAMLCDDERSRYRLARSCYQSLKETENWDEEELLRTVLAETLSQLDKDDKARVIASPLLESLDPESKLFARIKQLFGHLGMQRELARELSSQGQEQGGKGAYCYHLEAARASKAVNDRVTAMLHYARALEFAPGNRELEREFYRFGCLTSGFPYFMQSLLEKTSGHFEFYRFLGDYYLQSGHGRNATSFLKLANSGNFTSPYSQRLLARALLFTGKAEKARKLLLESLKERETIPIDRSTLSLFRHALKEGKKSLLQRFLHPWLEHPNEAFRSYVSNMALLAGFESEVLEAAKECEAKDPFAPTLSRQRAEILETVGEIERAKEVKERALERLASIGAGFPSKSSSMNLLDSYMKGLQGKDEVLQASRILERLLENRAESIELWETYVTLLEKRQRGSLVIQALSRIISLLDYDKEKRLSKIRQLMAKLYETGILDEYISEISSEKASCPSPRQRRERLYSIYWAAKLMGDDAALEKSKRALIGKARTLEKEGIYLLRELEAWDELVAQLDELSNREGVSGLAENLILKAKILWKELEQPERSLLALKEIYHRWPMSTWAREARVMALKVAMEEKLPNSNLASAIKGLEPETKELSSSDLMLLFRTCMAREEYSKALSFLREIRYRSGFLSREVLKDLNKGLCEAVELCKGSGETLSLWRELALLAVKLEQNSSPELSSLRESLQSCRQSIEKLHFERLLGIVQSHGGSGFAIKLYQRALEQEKGGDSLTAFASLARIVRIRPSRRDIFGNYLAQSARLEAARIAKKLHCPGTMRRIHRDMANDSLRHGPDFPGGVLRRCEELILGISPGWRERSLEAMDLLLQSLLESDELQQRRCMKLALEEVNRLPALSFGDMKTVFALSKSLRPDEELLRMLKHSLKNRTGRDKRILELDLIALYLDPRNPCFAPEKGKGIIDAWESSNHLGGKSKRRLLKLKAQYHRCMKNYDKAAELFRKSGKVYDEGVCWQYLGKWSKAIRCFDDYVKRKGKIAKGARNRIRRTITSFLDEGGRNLPLRSSLMRKILEQEQAMRHL